MFKVANPFSDIDLVWKPEHHPRWPKGSGKKSGKFMPKAGGSADAPKSGLQYSPKKGAMTSDGVSLKTKPEKRWSSSGYVIPEQAPHSGLFWNADDPSSSKASAIAYGDKVAEEASMHGKTWQGQQHGDNVGISTPGLPPDDVKQAIAKAYPHAKTLNYVAGTHFHTEDLHAPSLDTKLSIGQLSLADKLKDHNLVVGYKAVLPTIVRSTGLGGQELADKALADGYLNPTSIPITGTWTPSGGGQIDLDGFPAKEPMNKLLEQYKPTKVTVGGSLIWPSPAQLKSQQKKQRKKKDKADAPAQGGPDTPSFDPSKFAGHFDSLPEAELWASQKYQPFFDSLTEGEHEALKSYKDGGYKSINDTLRSGAKPYGQVKERIDNLDAAFDQAPTLEEPTIVYRGRLPNPILDAFENGEEDGLVGLSIKDPGYLSTSLERGTGKDFSESTHYPPSVGKITLPAGYNPIYVENITHMNEAEMLLPRDSKIKINSVHTLPSGTRWVEGEVVLDV